MTGYRIIGVGFTRRHENISRAGNTFCNDHRIVRLNIDINIIARCTQVTQFGQTLGLADGDRNFSRSIARLLAGLGWVK